MTDGQAQSCTLTNRLGGEERFKNFTLNIGFYTRPIIADGDDHPIISQLRFEADFGLPLASYGFSGVRKKIHPYLIELTRIADNRLQLGEIGLNRDFVAPIILAENLEGRFQP